MSEKRIEEIKKVINKEGSRQDSCHGIEEIDIVCSECLAQALAASEHNFIIDARKDELGKLANDLSGNKVNIKFVELLERITKLEGMKK